MIAKMSQFLLRLIPDSPRWMLRMGHIDKTKAILLKAAATNKRTVPMDLDLQLKLQASSL